MVDNYQKILIIGAGPVVIGQSAEYDYAAVQACVAFHEDNIKVVVVNSNPASISTDTGVADSVYIEPLNIDTIKRVIQTEKPDAIIPTLSGGIGFEIALELHQNGFLEENGVQILSVNVDTINALYKPEDIRAFLLNIKEPVVAFTIADNIDNVISFADAAGLPVTIKPAYESDEKNSKICADNKTLMETSKKLFEDSYLHQVFVEKSIVGWKEISYEVMRDCAGNCICVSNMESIDPVGIHTGDSIVVAPAQTLTDQEGLILRSAALNIIDGLSICGNCGIQFALNPVTGEYAVMSITPGLSRSSALLSKVTGYPIARVAAKLAIGYKLFEIKNDITGCTTACNEPAIDYCAVKFPKWSFDRFLHAQRKLGIGMQATGETVSIGTSFELAFMKALISSSMASVSASPSMPKFRGLSNDELLITISASSDERIFAVYEAIKRGIPFDIIYSITFIDKWFLSKLNNISDTERMLMDSVSDEHYQCAKKIGFLDETIKNISIAGGPFQPVPSYNMIDTCAAEFDAVRPYYYATYDDEDEAYMAANYYDETKRKILVIGSGPASIGHSGELDYCNVHCVKALKSIGYFTIMLNNNSSSVSTDFYLTDRLYLDPVSKEDIENLIVTEKPYAVITQFSGNNSYELSRLIEGLNVKLLGPDSELEAILKNPEKLRRRLTALNLPFTTEKHFNATGLELDVICDGADCIIPGIAEHIEKSEIHPGDAISVYPSLTLNEKIKQTVADYACKIALGLEIKGIVNIQMVLYDNRVYITGVSTKSFHNIPFMSKATGLPIIEIAVRSMLGQKITDMGFHPGVYSSKNLYAVRVPVFSFDKISGTDTQLGGEMKSTGEVLGIADNFEDALMKGLVASGMRIKRSGGVLVTVRNSDKQEAIVVADRFSQLGFTIYATAGTAKTLNANYVASNSIRKLHEGTPNILDLINSKKIVYVISTSEKAENAAGDDIQIRRKAIEKQIPTFTTLDTAAALVRCLAMKRSLEDIALIDITKI